MLFKFSKYFKYEYEVPIKLKSNDNYVKWLWIKWLWIEMNMKKKMDGHLNLSVCYRNFNKKI